MVWNRLDCRSCGRQFTSRVQRHDHEQHMCLRTPVACPGCGSRVLPLRLRQHRYRDCTSTHQPERAPTQHFGIYRAPAPLGSGNDRSAIVETITIVDSEEEYADASTTRNPATLRTQAGAPPTSSISFARSSPAQPAPSHNSYLATDAISVENPADGRVEVALASVPAASRTQAEPLSNRRLLPARLVREQTAQSNNRYVASDTICVEDLADERIEVTVSSVPASSRTHVRQPREHKIRPLPSTRETSATGAADIELVGMLSVEDAVAERSQVATARGEVVDLTE